MTRKSAPAIKFGAFAVVMTVLTAFLFMVFGQFRGGDSNTYSAIFNDVSDLKSGDTVRVAGARVGTVSDVRLEEDNRVTVRFDADNGVKLTTGTQAAVRYLNLVGDRYLELVDGPGSTRLLQPGSVIPVERTSPALDLDLLLGGLKPVIQGLNARDVNALSASLLQIMQGQEGTLDSLLSRTSSFTATLADNGQVVQQLIDNLKDVLATVSKDGAQFSALLDRLERLVTELSNERDPIGDAIDALDKGTASITDLLTQARPPLAGTIDQLNRLAPNLAQEKDRLDQALQKAPENYRKLVRIGSYGNFLQLFLCGVTLRLNDPTGKVLVLPTLKPNYGRCKDA
jgi:phospholipid/cholesterol/gamma-HCH transport system substrate-binding protein